MVKDDQARTKLDCANYALNNWNRGPWDMLRSPDEPAPPVAMM